MSNAGTLAATTICSGLEYWVERGEIEHIMDVQPGIRYTDKQTHYFTVVCDKQVIRFTAEDLGPMTHMVCEFCGPEDEPDCFEECVCQCHDVRTM